MFRQIELITKYTYEISVIFGAFSECAHYEIAVFNTKPYERCCGDSPWIYAEDVEEITNMVYDCVGWEVNTAYEFEM